MKSTTRQGSHYKFNPKNLGPLLIIIAPLVALIGVGACVASSWQ